MIAVCLADLGQFLITDKKGESRIDSIGPGFFYGGKMKKLALILMVLGLVAHSNVLAADVSDLENLSLPPDSSWNGSDLEGSYSATDAFKTGTASFNNFYAYDAVYMYSSWGGFAYSNMKDTTATGFTAQYNAIPGSGQSNSDTYAIGYCNTLADGQPMITFEAPEAMTGAYFSNTNYAYYSMLNGDQFAKKFEAGDWFKLTITGKDEAGVETGNVDFLLADGTEIIDVWTWVDLSILGKIKSISFSLSSSDTGAFGMNTPSYFALDSINDPEQADVDDEDDDDDWLEGCFIGVTKGAMQ